MSFDIDRMLETPIAGNVIALWVLAALVAVVLIIVLLAVKGILGRSLRPTGAPQELSWRHVLRDLVHRTSFLFIVAVALYAGATVLALPANIEAAVRSIFAIVLFVQAALWGDRMVGALMSWHLGRHGNGSVRSALTLIHFMGRLAVWSIAVLLSLDNIGFDVTALVAGLGIGGVAVALAAQSILGDLFASLAIVLDRPFEVGDFIVFGDGYLGTVERIGIKTTRLRALSGEQLICANNDLLGSRIRNYKRMQERRVVFSIGVTYETPSEKLARIPRMLKDIIEAQGSKTRFDRAHFQKFGESSLDFEIVHWVQSPDFNFYMDLQQAINLAIFSAFAEQGIDFAHPMRVVQIPQSQVAASGPSPSSDLR